MGSLSVTGLFVLQALAQGHKFGFDIMDVTSLPSGTVYPALSRLETLRSGPLGLGDRQGSARQRPPAPPLLRADETGRAQLVDAESRYRAVAKLFPNRGRAVMKTLIYLFSLLAPRRLRAAWREEWLGELHAARRAGGAVARSVLRSARRSTRCRRDGPPRRQPGSRWQGPWRSDLLQTVRALRRSPGHVAVVALCLGVGIAVCTTTFSILNAFTAGELPGVTRARADWTAASRAAGIPLAWPTTRSCVEGSPSFAGIAAEGSGIFAMRVEGQAPMNVGGAFVSGNYFEVLGTRPHLGRLLHPSDDRPDAPLAVAISHAFWTARLGAPADIVGKTIVIGGRDAVVTGVAPQGFRGLRGGEMNEASGFAVYVPLAHVRDWPGARRPEQRWLNVYGRLTVPLDRDRLAAELLPLAGRIEAHRPGHPAQCPHRRHRELAHAGTRR